MNIGIKNNQKKNTTNGQSNYLDLKSKRNVGIQTIVQQKEYISPSIARQHNLETEEYTKIVTLPHNIIALFVLLSILAYLSSIPSINFEESAKRGLICCVICIIVFGCLYLPDSMLRRPHPIIWRFLTSCAICYLLIIVFVLFQNPENVRNFLKFFDQNLGTRLPEKNYADACEVTQPNFPYIKLDNFLDSIDMYMIAHFCGWYVKMLVVRDVKICWFLSIGFEILELTFRHWLPNFYECWWDHLILDVFGMNALGIWLGSLTCKYFEMKTYNWIEKRNVTNNNDNNDTLEIKNKDKLKKDNPVSKRIYKLLNYFTPNYYVKHDWDIFSSVKRFYSVCWFFVFMNLVDLSHFFNKYILWIPQTHRILEIRIYLWGMLALISAREYYEYLTNKTVKRLGHNVWLAHVILFVELLILFKFSDGMLSIPFPKHVIYFWTVVFMIVSGITIHLIKKDFIKYFKKSQGDEKVDLLEHEIVIEYIESKN